MKKILLKKEREDKKKLEEIKVENGLNFEKKEATETLNKLETYPNVNETFIDFNYHKKNFPNPIEIKNHNDSKQYLDKNSVNFSNNFVTNHCLYPKSYFSQISYSKEIFPELKYLTSREIIAFSDKNKTLNNDYTNKIIFQNSKKDQKNINYNKHFIYPHENANNKDAWVQSLTQSNSHSLSYMLGKRGPNSPLQVPITPTSHNFHNFHSQPLYLSPSGHYLFSIPQQLSKTDHHEEKKVNSKNDVFQFNQMSSFINQHRLQTFLSQKNYNKDNRGYLQEYNHQAQHNTIYNHAHKEMSTKNGSIEENKSLQCTNGSKNSYKSTGLNINGNTLKSLENSSKNNKDVSNHGPAVKDELSKSYDMKSILNKESVVKPIQLSSSIPPQNAASSNITANQTLKDATHHNSSQLHNAINKNYCVKEEKLEKKVENDLHKNEQKQLQKDVKKEPTQENYDNEKTNTRVRSKGRPTKNTTVFNSGSLSKPIIKCLICSKVFNNSSALAKHKLTHSDERRYTCNLCSKAFKRQDHLNGHMMTHSSKKPFECKFAHCFKSYCDARSLKRHLQNYHQASTKSNDVQLEAGGGSKMADVWAPGFNPLDEPKPIKCMVCGRGFRNIAALNGHMRLHGGYLNRQEPLELKVNKKINSEDSLDSSKHVEDQGKSFNVIPKHGDIKTQQIQTNEMASDDGVQKIMNFKSKNDGKKELSMQSLKINDVADDKLSQTSNLLSNKSFETTVQNFGNVKDTSKEATEKRRGEQNNSTINSSFKESLLYMRRLRKNSEKSSSRSNTSRRSSLEDNTSGKQNDKVRVNNDADVSKDEYHDASHYSVHKKTSLQAWVDSVPAIYANNTETTKNDCSLKNVMTNEEKNFSSVKSFAYNLSSSNEALSKLDINNDESSKNVFRADFQASSNKINGLNVSKTKHVYYQHGEQVNVFNKPNEKTEVRRGSPSLPSTPFTAHTPYTPRTCGPQSPNEANHFEFPCVPSQDSSQAAIPSSTQCARDPHARTDKGTNKADLIPVLSPQSGAKCAFIPPQTDSHKYNQTFPRQKSTSRHSRNMTPINNNVPYTPPPILSPVVNRASVCDVREKVHNRKTIETNPLIANKKTFAEHKSLNKNSNIASTLPHVNIGALYQAVLPSYNGDSSQNALKKSQPLEKPTETLWSGAEVALFEEAMNLHGKNFAMISQKVRTKNTKKCILFYYTWKKKSIEKYRAFKCIHSSKRYNLRCGK